MTAAGLCTEIIGRLQGCANLHCAAKYMNVLGLDLMAWQHAFFDERHHDNCNVQNRERVKIGHTDACRTDEL